VAVLKHNPTTFLDALVDELLGLSSLALTQGDLEASLLLGLGVFLQTGKRISSR
jgi:hypothetical protein